MTGSRKIRVVKRHGGVEPFDAGKLRLCLWRAMGGRPRRFPHAQHLSQAIATYLLWNGTKVVSSRAVFEMAVRALRQTAGDPAADALEAMHQRRRQARRRLVLVQDNGRLTAWDRHWITQQFRHRWEVGHAAARAMSGWVERRCLGRSGCIARQAVLDEVDSAVEAFGLAPWCLLASVPAEWPER